MEKDFINIYIAGCDRDNQSAAAKDLLKLVLNDIGALAKYPECDFSVISGKNDKPYFKNCGAIKFNLSHSNDKAVCAVSNADIGVDIEIGNNKVLPLERKILDLNEIKLLESLNGESEKIEFLTKKWVMLESLFKLSGDGIKGIFGALPQIFALNKNVFTVHDGKDEIFLYNYDIGNYKLCAASPLNVCPVIKYR